MVEVDFERVFRRLVGNSKIVRTLRSWLVRHLELRAAVEIERELALTRSRGKMRWSWLKVV